MIAVLCGGVGAARMLAALQLVYPATDTVAIVNTADDLEIHGLRVSPDLDTITYTLSGAIDPVRGWGLAGESWQSMDALARFSSHRPSTSSAGATWFNLGDRDLATHLYRTGRLAEGASLSTVTAEIAAAFEVVQTLVPMTDDPVRTRLVPRADPAAGRHDELSFQEYFVRERHSVPIEQIRFDGADIATPNASMIDALDNAELIVIAPSNPLLSIAPIRSLVGVDEVLRRRRNDVVAVSPIVGGAAIKGPADRLMAELGWQPSVVGVAECYRDVAGHLVIDPVDRDDVDAIVAAGMAAVVVPSIMRDHESSRRLAAAVIAAAS